jgi:hypothetical protein
LYRLSNAARRFFESWVSDDITNAVAFPMGGVEVGVEAIVAVEVGTGAAEAWITTGIDAEPDWIG